GVHRGHRAAIDAAKAAGLSSGVVTFGAHPRIILGYEVQLLTQLASRLYLLDEAGPDDLLGVEFTPELARLEPEAFVDAVLRPFGTRIVAVGEGFRFGAGRRGDADLLRREAFDVRSVPLV